MRTKEFVKRVEELGYEVKIRETNCKIFNNDMAVGSVDNLTYMRMTNYCFEYGHLCDEDKEKLFDLMIEYAKTPIKDRKEEKKFYLRHKWLENSDEFNYLNYEIGLDNYTLHDASDKSWVRVKFTLKEIEEIKEKFDTDLADFEMVEVKDEKV